MAFQDRHYYRDQSGPPNPLMWIFTGSVPLFTAFGIRVRAHASLILTIGLMLLFSGSRAGIGVWNSMVFSTTLFGIILLHEFGHCFAARRVGGDAEEIMLWPLGGLAFANAPKRAWPQFFTAAGGPLVNVLICLLAGGGLWLLRYSVQWNPLSQHFGVPYGNELAYYLWFIFTLSWGLLLFNLLPIYPLDGGRLLQALLWFKIGYYRASMIAFTVGMVGSVLMAMYGICFIFSWFGQILIFLAISCFMQCYQNRLILKADGPFQQDDDGVDYSAAYEIEPKRQSRASQRADNRATKRAAKLAAEEREERVRIDAILAKVSAQGMQSLTWTEKRALKQATEHQRQRDVELPRNRRL